MVWWNSLPLIRRVRCPSLWVAHLGQWCVLGKTYIDDRYDTTSDCVRFEEWKLPKSYSSNVTQIVVLLPNWCTITKRILIKYCKFNKLNSGCSANSLVQFFLIINIPWLIKNALKYIITTSCTRVSGFQVSISIILYRSWRGGYTRWYLLKLPIGA